MKINQYLKKSLARQFVSLMGISIGSFLVGAAILWLSLHFFKENYTNQMTLLEKKEKLAQEINDSFTIAFSEARGYFAYGNPILKENALAQGKKVIDLEQRFGEVSTTEQDKKYLNDVYQFTTYYHKGVLLESLLEYENGHLEKVANKANTDVTAKIKSFQTDTQTYLNDLGVKLDKSFDRLIRLQTYAQMSFFLFIFIILLTLLIITRITLRKVGYPLSQLAIAANEMASGKEVPIDNIGSNREDEIGSLSIAFRKMVETVQDKEQDLVAQNEELLAQQDELQAQQSELEELYEKSEEDRRLNQDILNTVQEGIQFIGVHGEIVQVNKQLQEMFQWKQSADAIVGLKCNEWISVMTEDVEDRATFIQFLEAAIQTENLSENDPNTFIYQKINQKQVIKVYYEGLYHGDEKRGTVLVYRDITKEFEVDQMKSEFVSTVSHELRTPLASILGFTELMLNRELKVERQQKYLQTIYNEAKRLTALINDFLDVQRMEAGKQSYEKKFIQLSPIIEKVVENQQISTSQHHIRFINYGGKDFILGDRCKIEQVFTNLINNAIKYSPNGGDVEVKLYQKEGKLQIDIKDKGLGIPEDSISNLFSRFFRIDNSDRRRIGGTGLGLAIVQEIMKAHDGNVLVQSEYGKGSTFTCTFPLVLAQSEHVSIDERARDFAVGYKVLIVEDDHSLGHLISQELKESGFQVSYYKKGLDAFESLKHDIPDAIVLDILLEEDEIDGWEIMESVKNEEILKNIPIFVSTALDEKEKGYSLGATDYLIKPYKPSQLSKAIMQTLLKMGKVGQVYIPQEMYEEKE